MPDLLQFKETIIDVEGGAEHTIGLKFSPVMKTGAAEVMVFINDEEVRVCVGYSLAASLPTTNRQRKFKGP
jgi:hypothetical protein